jgi:hypothetical protein
MNARQIPPSDWIALSQVDSAYPLSPRTAWKLIAEGKLKAYKPFSKKTLLRRSEIDRLIERSQVGLDLDRIVDETVAEVLGK